MKGASDITLYLEEHISLVESYALVMFGCLLKQIRLHMNLYTVAHLCSINICGMMTCFYLKLKKDYDLPFSSKIFHIAINFKIKIYICFFSTMCLSKIALSRKDTPGTYYWAQP